MLLHRKLCFFLLCTHENIAHGESVHADLSNEFYLDVDEVMMSTGYFHTCAIERRAGVDIGGPLRCWGQNDRGQASPPPGIFVQVSSGHLFSCAVGLDEKVQCWGENTEVPKGYFTQVSTGQSHVCGLLKNRSLRCWGRNDYGESDPTPTGPFVQVSKRRLHICVLRFLKRIHVALPLE